MTYISEYGFYREALPVTEPMLPVLLAEVNNPSSRQVQASENASRTLLARLEHRTLEAADHIPLEVIVTDLQSNHWKQRVDALRVVIGQGKQQCFKLLPLLHSVLLHDPSELVRVTAIDAIATLEELIPLHTLLAALEDPCWEVRAAVARIFGDINQQMIVEVLKEKYQKEEDESVRETIIRSLGRKGARMPVKFLCSIVRYDPSWLVREAAAWALGQLGEHAPIQPLVDTLESDIDESVRAAAIRALGRIGNREVEPLLFSILRESEEEVREAAVWALQQLDVETRGMHRKEDQWWENIQPTVFALTDFLKEKKGSIQKPVMIEAPHEQTLLVCCTYQASGHPFLGTPLHVESVIQPMEEALSGHDEVVRELIEQAAQAWEIQQWQDLFIVSLYFSRSDEQNTSTQKPLRVLVSGIGYRHLDQAVSHVLPRLIEAVEDVVQEQRGLQYSPSHCLRDLNIWYQPGSPYAVAS
jgi:hypothetical protein